MPKKYRSDIAAAVHEAVQDLHDIGLVSTRTMRRFDRSCLTEIKPLSPLEIVEVRQSAGVSQSVFAQYLNVTTGLVSKWERGEKQPRGASLKLLTLVKNKGLDAIS